MSPMFCPVCQTTPVFPVQLKCDHILCYLCLKGVVNTTKKCPLCIRAIDANAVHRPKFVTSDVHTDRHDFNGLQWFYEGRPGQGFWAYDHSTCLHLEQSFSSDQKKCEITISGLVYCVDFVQQIQYQKDCPSKRRKVRRDLLANISVFKGVAGVSKYLIPDMIGPNSAPNVNTSGQQLPTSDADSESDDADQRSAKRIKVEVKKEVESTTD